MLSSRPGGSYGVLNREIDVWNPRDFLNDSIFIRCLQKSVGIPFLILSQLFTPNLMHSRSMVVFPSSRRTPRLVFAFGLPVYLFEDFRGENLDRVVLWQL